MQKYTACIIDLVDKILNTVLTIGSFGSFAAFSESASSFEELQFSWKPRAAAARTKGSKFETGGAGWRRKTALE